MAKLKSSLCPSCSAPLEFGPEHTSVVCRYCGNTIQVEREKKAPPPGQVRAHVVYVNSAPKVPAAVRLLAVLPVLIPVAVFVVPELVKLNGRNVKSLPVECALNEEIEISGLQFQGKGTLVNAATNCKVHIVNSTLSGGIIVNATGPNVQIKVENSKLHATDTLFELDRSLTSLRVSQKSTLSSDGMGLTGKFNIDATFEDSSMKVADGLVRGTTNLKIAATRSELTGKSGIALGPNAEVDLKNTKLHAAGTALSGESNLKFNCDACTVEGADAVRAGSNATILLSDKSQITASAVGIEGDSSLDLGLEGARIDAKDVGVVGESSLRMRLTQGSVIKAGRVGVRAESSPSIALRDSRIEAGGSAIEGRNNVQIDATKSAISGGQFALALHAKPSQLSLSETTLSGAQNFNADLSAHPQVANPSSTSAGPRHK